MEYLYGIIIIIGLYVILATSFNLIIGYGGLVSIAHPVFFALGAYTSAVLSRDFGAPVLLAMLARHARSAARVDRARAAVAAGIRRLSADRQHRFSAWHPGSDQERPLHRRPRGFTNIPPFLIREFGRESYVVLVLAVMIAVILLVWWISRSDYGRAMSAMRDDELAFSSIGRDAMWMKIAIFGLGSGIAGLAGSLYAHYFRFIAPEQFEILQSSVILTMVVVGGLRTTWGPVVGALLLQALPQAISFLHLPPSVLGPIQGFCSPDWCWSSCSSDHRTGAGQGSLARGTASDWQGGREPLMAGVLEVRDLSKSFDGIVVASHIDLTLQSGSIVGLIGPNGAGKTSLFNLISGVVKFDSGTVLLDGSPLDRLKFHQRVRGGLSRTWQHTRLFPSLPVIDNLLIATHDYPGERLVNVLFGRRRLKAHDSVARDKAVGILGKMGLANVADDLVSDLPTVSKAGRRCPCPDGRCQVFVAR